jgi:phosphoenolpyruvate synthase/pyruvate phosphate dikinase
MIQGSFTKEVLEKVLAKGWEFGYERRMTYQMMYLFYSGYRSQLNTLFGTNFSDYLFRVREGNNSQYCWKENEEKNLLVIKERLNKEDAVFIDSLGNIIKEEFTKIADYSARIEHDYAEFNNSELILKYTEFKKYQEMISLPVWILFTPLEHILTDVVKEKLVAKGLPEEKVLETLNTLSMPTETIPLDVYLTALSEIVLVPESEKDMKLDECTTTFAHMGMFDINYEETVRSYHENKLKEMNEDKAEAFLKDAQQKYKERANKTEAVIKRFESDVYLTALLRFFILYANSKEWKNIYRERFTYKSKPLFIEIAKRLGLSVEETGFMTFDEICEYLVAGGDTSGLFLKKRIENSIFVFLDDEIHITTDLDYIQSIDSNLSGKEVSELRGTSAFSGVVRGTVKIVISGNDFHKVKKGDILVTSTTRPDFIKVMEEAAAFVTNEGGMLSHAAILAREMKKPCVIGTKNATKVLKDGDMVEVDAENGIVRII